MNIQIFGRKTLIPRKQSAISRSVESSTVYRYEGKRE